MPNVTDDGMRAYLAVFHDEYRRAALQRLPGELRDALDRSSQFGRGLVGYVSTQFGAGFEYAAEASGVRIVKGSARVEDLLFTAPRRVRTAGPMISIGGSNCAIERLTLDGVFPVRLSSTDASVRLREMRARAGGWVREVQWAELFGDRTAAAWSTDRAVRRALDELLVAVIDAREMERRQLDLGEFLLRFRQRHVLLLGDFISGRDRLAVIAAAVERHGYLPLYADEIPDIRNQDLRQKVLMLALASRFVLIDDSSRAGQLTEVPLVELARAVTIVLRLSGSSSSWMTEGLSLSSRVIRELNYDMISIDEVVAQGIAWAEAELQRRDSALDDRFPWRDSTAAEQ